jgi:hypothetical protein
VLSSGTGFLAPVIGAMRKHRRQFSASTGTPGPHDFAVRAMPFVRVQTHAATCHVHRIASPTFVTTRARPSSGPERAQHRPDLLIFGSYLFFAAGLERAFSLGSQAK